MTERILTATERLRHQLMGGKVATVGAPTRSVRTDDFLAQATAQEDNGSVSTLATQMATPPRPGVFIQPSPQPEEAADSAVLAVDSGDVALVRPALAEKPAAPAISVQERLRQATAGSTPQVNAQARREMSSMKTLTRMLEAVFARPGSTASDQARMAALSGLAINARELGVVVARVAGDDAERNNYVAAMATDAAVSLVCHSWEARSDVNWPRLLEASVGNSEIMSLADTLAYAQSLQYDVAETPQAVVDRLAVSMHSAFWRLIELGDVVPGITPKLAAEIVRDISQYLQSRDRFVSDTTLHVTWMQSSINRMTNLICAELRARFGGRSVEPLRGEIETALAVSRSGFEGVENYAQSILDKSGPVNADRPGN